MKGATVKSINRKSHPPANTVAQSIKQLTDLDYINNAAQCAAVFDQRETAKELLAMWKAADPRGTPTEIALRDEQLAIAQQNFDAIEAKFRTFRGDFGNADQTALPSSTAISSLPTPLTTSDVAHSFAGLRWPTELAWKKPLGDKPKWLSGCIAIPGSRGRSETRWNPVLIGGALVHGGHVRVNRVRARFQTVPQLLPWLEAWKTYEADNFDKP